MPMTRLPVVLLALSLLSACEGAPAPLGPPPGKDLGVGLLDGAVPDTDGAKPKADGAKPKADGPQGKDGPQQKDGAPPDSKKPSDGAPPKPDAGKLHPARYPATRTHSPVSPFVVQNLKQIAKKGPAMKAGIFAKVGDSITVSKSFLSCYAGSAYNLGSHTQLAGTIKHFKVSLSGGTTPFNRTSLAAKVGWSASAAIKGAPSPLAQELSAISPRFAVVMYGTNDIGYKNIFSYADNMLDITDNLLKGGVIPLLSTIPPRLDKAWAGLEVPRYNLVIRGIAQARQVPLMDFNRELAKLSGQGMAPDGVHPKALWTSSGAGACDLSAKGLAYGYNTRNLLTLESLSRVKAVLLDGKPALDPAGPALQGSGGPKAPFVIDALPFTDLRNTSASPHKTIHSYPGCKATQNESGGEYFYRLTLAKASTIRAMVFDRGTVDIDVHLLGAQVSGAACLKRDHKELTAQLKAGTYHLALDTFVKGGAAQSGEYLLVVIKE